MPVVQLWEDVKSVSPKIKGQPGDFAVARNDLQQAWHGLLKMSKDENKPHEALVISLISCTMCLAH
jgi:hypothetical protein